MGHRDFFKSEIENVGTKSRAARPFARRHTICRVAVFPAERLGGRLGSLINQISSTRDAFALDPDTRFCENFVSSLKFFSNSKFLVMICFGSSFVEFGILIRGSLNVIKRIMQLSKRNRFSPASLRSGLQLRRAHVRNAAQSVEGDLTIPLEGDLKIPVGEAITNPLEMRLVNSSCWKAFNNPLEADLTVPLEGYLTKGPLEGDLTIPIRRQIIPIGVEGDFNNSFGRQFNHRPIQIAPPGMNTSQDIKMQMVDDNVGNQIVENKNRLSVVPGIANQNPNGNGNVVAARAEGNAIENNGNQIRCYNCRGLGHLARNCTVRPRRRDAAYLQTQLLIAQKEEA
ncbi:putative RNA-directed DNA polymerase [Tanacetum coccineum]